MKVTDQQKRRLKAVARAIEAVFIVAYGSLVRGEGREDSDLDIAVMTRQTPDYELFGKSFSLLSDVFSGKTVDVRFLNGADPLFAMQVVRDGILLYGDPDAYDDYRMLTNRRYIDDGRKYFPFLDEHIKEQQIRLQRSLL